jgi:hypothetical protein
MAQLKGVQGGRPAVHGGPPWMDAPEVPAPGMLEPGTPEPAAPAAPDRDRDEARTEVRVRSGRHRRTRRKAAGGQHSR